MPKSEWRLVPDHPSYAVFDSGRIVSIRGREVFGARGPGNTRQVTLTYGELYVGCERRRRYVHQVVAMAFGVISQWGDPVGFKNGNPQDCRLENLYSKKERYE